MALNVATPPPSRPPTTATPPVGPLAIDAREFAAAFDRRAFAVRHTLADHPLLALERIAELADALPARAIERHQGDLPLLMPGGAPELTGRPSDTVRGIEHNGCWMVLWNIEQAPEYRDLLDACLDQAEGMLPAGVSHLRREAFLFLSAPNAVTPAHFDPEHNFLLQIRGLKEMNVAPFPDRAAALRELDRYHDGGHRNLVSVPDGARTFQMRAGDGVYVYPWAPHWVLNGPEPSMSLSITFRTADSRRAEQVHRCNARLRKLGRSPRPQGESARTDRMKSAAMTVMARMRSPWGKPSISR